MENISDSPQGTPPSSRRSRSSSSNRFYKSNSSTSPKQVKKLVESMLKHAAFVGQYKATQRVDSLGEYRNVIQIEENDTLIPIITWLQPRIIQAFPNCWPGITLPGNLSSQDGYCFWAEDCDKIFEPYQFRITDICFTPQEVRFVIQADCKLATPMNEDIYDVLSVSLDSVKGISKKCVFGIWNLLTKENIFSTLQFVFALISLFGAVGVYLLEYFLKLLNAISNLIKVSTPAILKILDIVQRVCGAGFYLAGMIWRDLIGQNWRSERIQVSMNYRPKCLKY